MIRTHYLEAIQAKMQINPVVALLGPRQCGKTTLAKQYLKQQSVPCSYFDLENPVDLEQLKQPMLALEDLTGLIIIDEIQRAPDIFPVIRVLVDQHKDRQFLILGSASRDLIRQSSETLAGRISYIECMPFTLLETENTQALLSRGGFPQSYLAANDAISYGWRQDYIATFLERDIPNLGFRIPPQTMRRFWMMLTHYHGQIFNASELGKSLGIAHTTSRHYLDILVGTFMIRELTPWLENIKKRQVKAPKIYFRDAGLYLALLNISNYTALQTHPKLGATWEGFAMEQIISAYQVASEQCFYWGIHQQAELDLLLMIEGKRVGFEFKYRDAPEKTQSMITALETLQLDAFYIVYPGKRQYKITHDIIAIGLEEMIAMSSN